VNLLVDTTVSDEYIASIYRAEDENSAFLQKNGVYVKVHMVLNPEDHHQQRNKYSW
jgi:hypothetical protein